jgi:hypothetical protein
LPDKNRLRDFPTSSYIGLSSLCKTTTILEAHQKVGTHGHMAPDPISIANPRAMSVFSERELVIEVTQIKVATKRIIESVEVKIGIELPKDIDILQVIEK